MGENPARNPGAPVINKSDCPKIGNMSAHDRVSVGFDDTRDNSTRNSSEKPVPRYLRASTGSCHDLCKYGRRHEFEETARISLRKGIVKRSLNEQNSREVIVSDTQRKEKVVGHELSAVAKKQSFVVKPSPDTKSYLPKFRTSLDAKASLSSKARLSNSPTKKSTLSYPPEIIKGEVVLPSDEVEVPGKEGGDSIDTKMSRMSVKHSSLVRLKVEPLFASGNSDGVHGEARRDESVSTVRKMTVSASAKKVSLPLAASLSSRFSLVKTTSGKARKDGRLKLSACLKGPKTAHRIENEISKSESSEKTLRVIRIRMENDASESVPDDCAVSGLPSPSLPNSLSHAKFPCPLPSEEDEVVSDNTIPMEVVEVQPANDALESIPVDRSSQKSLSREEDNRETEYNGNEADEFVSVKEKRKKIRVMGMEVIPLECIPHDNATLPSSSSSNTSSHSSSSSLFSHEEDDEQIMHTCSEADEILSQTSAPAEIIKVQPMKQNHNKTLWKSRSVLSEDKHRCPVKLKFRSGRLLDLKPENNTPKRLKFWRTRVNTNTTIDLASDKKKSLAIGSPQSVKENQTKPSRRSRRLVSEDKYRSPIKIFRMEKSLRPQSDNNTPRKLRFRRAKALGAEDNKSDSRRRIFRRDGDKNDTIGAELSTHTFTLKHQDLHGKRDAQGLLNNIIEETASKLVESQKGKVKALVGAFESVISLQERKPSLRSVS